MKRKGFGELATKHLLALNLASCRVNETVLTSVESRRGTVGRLARFSSRVMDDGSDDDAIELSIDQSKPEVLSWPGRRPQGNKRWWNSERTWKQAYDTIEEMVVIQVGLLTNE
jgi:hypothetical protein